MILCVSKINVNKAWIQAKIHAEPASQKSFANQWCRMPTWHGEWRHREISYITFWIIFCVKNTKKCDNWGRGEIFIMFYEISFSTFLEYYSTMIHSKFHSILLKNFNGNGTETWLLAKNAKWRKRIWSVAISIIINNASITQNTGFMYINGFILETCHISMTSKIIFLHRNVNN